MIVRMGWVAVSRTISACTQNSLAGGASDACIAEMCNMLSYSMQLMELYNSKNWLRSEFLGPRVEKPYLFVCVDKSCGQLTDYMLSEYFILLALLLHRA